MPLFLGWLVVAARLCWNHRAAAADYAAQGRAAAGFALDVAAFAGLSAVALSASLLPWRAARRALAGLLGVFLLVLAYGGQLHVEFFLSPLDVREAGHAAELATVASSVYALARAVDVLALVVLPLALLGLALARDRRAKAWLPPALAVACVLAARLGLSWREEQAGLYETNSFVAAVEQLLRGARPDQGFELAWAAPEALARDFPPEPGSALLDPRMPFFRHRGLDGLTARLAAAGVATGPRPNLVVIVLESMRAHEVSAWESHDGLTPALDALSAESLLFERFYAASWQSVRGGFSVFCGYPSPPDGEDYIRNQVPLRFRCLPELLAAQGYATRWYYGFDKAFENEGAFWSQHGMQEIRDAPALGWPERKGFGISDGALYSAAARELGGLREPFLSVITTVSGHHPFVVPGGKEQPGTYAALREAAAYADSALGRFFEEARKQPWFGRTVFVITADHGVANLPDHGPLPPRARRPEIFFRIPLLIYSPDRVKPARISWPASQLDLLPTLLDLAGVEADAAWVGWSLFRPGPRRLLLAGLGGVHAVEGEVRCYAGQCWQWSGAGIATGPAPQPVDAPALTAWAQRASRVTQFLVRSGRLAP